jgi:catechol 2,3-dioxygenase-like lactoylglutathione lyase family enzyme
MLMQMTDRASAAPFGRIDQVGIVVRDLDSALERYSEVIDSTPWRLWTYGPELLSAQEYRGAAASFEIRIALSSSKPQIELIEPVRGPSVYDEWLDAHGEGQHHVGTFVADLDAGIAAMARHGFRVMQAGRGYGLDGDGGFAYLDTQDRLGVILELIEVPARRREPEETR